MTPEMEIMQKYAVEFMKKNIESSGDGDAPPYGFVMSAGGKYEIYAFSGEMMNDPRGKDVIALMLLKALSENHGSVSAFCSDAFYRESSIPCYARKYSCMARDHA